MIYTYLLSPIWFDIPIFGLTTNAQVILRERLRNKLRKPYYRSYNPEVLYHEIHSIVRWLKENWEGGVCVNFHMIWKTIVLKCIHIPPDYCIAIKCCCIKVIQLLGASTMSIIFKYLSKRFGYKGGRDIWSFYSHHGMQLFCQGM